jgi:hypothetical protein
MDIRDILLAIDAEIAKLLGTKAILSALSTGYNSVGVKTAELAQGPNTINSAQCSVMLAPRAMECCR